MNLEENSYQQDSKQWQDKCNRLLYYHVVLTLKDGNTVDGIIGRVDDDQVIVLVGENVIEDESRFGRPLAYPFFFPLYPYYYPYPYPYPYYPY